MAKRRLAISNDRARYFLDCADDIEFPREVYAHSFTCSCVVCRGFYASVDAVSQPECDWITGERIEWE